MGLEFTAHGLLSPGVHEADLAEVRSALGQFRRSDRRFRLFAKLAEYVDALQRAGMADSLIIDGSFVMQGVDEPNDIDLILVLRAGWDLSQNLNPFQYNLISRRAVRREFPFDVYPVRAASPEEAHWIDFFSKINVKWCDEFGFDPGAVKGLVRIAL